MVKSPLFLLHSWLPKAHVEAPLFGSVLLSGVMLKLGGYGFIIFAPFLQSQSLLFFYLTLIGGLLCCIYCFRSWDIKSLVAYSSVIHIGAVTLGTLSHTEFGL